MNEDSMVRLKTVSLNMTKHYNSPAWCLTLKGDERWCSRPPVMKHWSAAGTYRALMLYTQNTHTHTHTFTHSRDPNMETMSCVTRLKYQVAPKIEAKE